jgi:hypothetical protein
MIGPFGELALGMLLAQAVILLLIRPLILWYFKINRMVEAMESIDESLCYLPAVRQGRIAKRVQQKRVS